MPKHAPVTTADIIGALELLLEPWHGEVRVNGEALIERLRSAGTEADAMLDFLARLDFSQVTNLYVTSATRLDRTALRRAMEAESDG